MMRSSLLLAVLAVGLACSGIGSPAQAVGFEMFASATASTGEKPQSKIWLHAGAYWAVVDGPDGVAIYEKQGTTWVRGTYANAVLGSSGQADAKWNGTDLFILNYTSSPRLFKYSFDAGNRSWILATGFPVAVPIPSGSETMVLDQDSSGRLWTTAEGGGNINVYHSTSADHRTWTSSPIVLQSGVNSDDICSVVAFGGNKIGVFWSDQNRDQFGFRYHNDADAPGTWSAIEIADSGSGHADDHINLAFDSQGRVYAITKDDLDEMRVHRRAVDGTWTTRTNVLGGSSTRGVIMVAEQDAKVYVLYTRWGVSPERIEYRVADINTLTFGGQTTFISGSSNMNNVTDMKQLLPAGNLIALAEDTGSCWYNSIGTPPSGGPQPPGAPQSLLATLGAGGTSAQLSWSAPSGTAPDGYNIYRSVNGGTATKLNVALVTTTSFTDVAMQTGSHCYTVRALRTSLEGSASNQSCVDNTPATPPGAPTGLTAQLVDTPATAAMASYSFDAGSGQQATDATANANHARLGTSTDVDSADPSWVTGVAGSALQFDGTNDYAEAPDSPTLDPNGSFSIEAWVRRNTNSNSNTIVSKGFNNQRTYRVRISSSGTLEFLWEVSGGSNREATASSAFTDNAWHHVACVYDQPAGQNRIYIDGVLRATANVSGVPVTNSRVLLIGASNGSSSSRSDLMNGAIDALRIVPGVLYAADFTPPASATTAMPDAPLATIGGGDDGLAAQSVSLAWQAPVGGTAAAGYNVYRSLNGATSAKLNTALVTATAWSDASPGVGENCYTVKAVSAGGMEGSPSGSACVSTGEPPLPPPAAPATIQAALLGTNPESARVQWSASASGSPAVGYNVYRSVGGGPFTKLNTTLVTTTQIDDASLISGSHCYRVAGVDGQGREGSQSASACVNYTAPPPPAPNAPTALTANLVTTPGGPATGRGAWPFDEGSGQTFADATGLGHTGSLGSAPTADTADPLWTAGQTGSALLFDGSNDRAVVPDAADLRFASGFTIEAWIKRGSTSTTDCILSKGDSQRRNFWMTITSAGEIDFRWESSGGTNRGTKSSSGTIGDTNWHHVACVFDQAAGQNRIYRDGVLVESSSDSGTPITSTDPIYIGARLSSGSLTDWFIGTIDLARVSPGAVYTGTFTPPTSFGSGPPQTTAQLAWQAPGSGTPAAGYNVYRQLNGGGFTQLNAGLVTTTSFTDTAPPVGALCYQVTAVDALAQEGAASDAACVSNGVTKASAPIAAAFVPTAPFMAAAPNPFNPTTTIRFRIPVASQVRLAIYDVAGREVVRLASGGFAAGEHSIRWEGRDARGATVASGAYFAVLDAGDVHLRKKLVLVK